MMPSNDTLDGPALAARRQRLGLSQTALAKLLGVAQSSVTRWESGSRRIEHPKLLDAALRDLERSPNSPNGLSE